MLLLLKTIYFIYRVDNVARGMITLITKGENGSVWVSEGNQPIYEMNFPERTTLRKQ